MPIYYKTSGGRKFNFFPNHAGWVNFEVKAENRAILVLTPGPELKGPLYLVILGYSNNQKCAISKTGYDGPFVATEDTPNILSKTESRGFWMQWGNATIAVGKDGELKPLISYHDKKILDINYLGFCTASGVVGEWIFDMRQCGCPIKARPGGPLPCCATAKDGEVPKSAVVAIEEGGKKQYIIRAHFLIPAKMLPACAEGYLAWFGKEIHLHHYEVLTDFKGKWVDTTAPNIPEGAVVGGKDFEARPLYVGRVRLSDSVFVIGSVKPSTGLNASYGGHSKWYTEFQVLVAS